MKRNLVLLLLLALFGGGAWVYHKFVFAEYPSQIKQFDRDISLLDEKLISAQIIHSQMDLTANLIEKNLALSKSDSLAEDASLPFLEYITGILNNFEIKLMKLEPAKKSARLDYVRTPYTLTLEATFEELGKFINQLEKSERLITVEQFEVDNAVRKSGSMAEKGNYKKHEMILRISTLTLIKQR